MADASGYEIKIDSHEIKTIVGRPTLPAYGYEYQRKNLHIGDKSTSVLHPVKPKELGDCTFEYWDIVDPNAPTVKPVSDALQKWADEGPGAKRGNCTVIEYQLGKIHREAKFKGVVLMDFTPPNDEENGKVTLGFDERLPK